MAEATQASSSEHVQTLDVPEYEAALAHLERLQERIDGLRSTIPELVASLVQPAPSQAQAFANIRKSATQSTNDIQSFRDSWTSEETQQLFTRSKDSLEKNEDLTKAKDVPRYGWTER